MNIEARSALRTAGRDLVFPRLRVLLRRLAIAPILPLPVPSQIVELSRERSPPIFIGFRLQLIFEFLLVIAFFGGLEVNGFVGEVRSRPVTAPSKLKFDVVAFYLDLGDDGRIAFTERRTELLNPAGITFSIERLRPVRVELNTLSE